MTLSWAVGAVVLAAASFVYGLAGFGIGLVALAFLPFLMPPVVAIVLTTIYATIFALVVLLPLRRELALRALGDLVAGTVVGMPLGVWVLAALPASLLNRLIGLVLIVVVLLEWWGRLPSRLASRGWALGAGFLGGLIGGAVGTPGPPVILYAATQGWSPRAVKANLQAFFVVNQSLTLGGYWWAGLITPEVGWLTLLYAVPALFGVGAGVASFHRLDAKRFRMLVFGLLLISGVVLLVRG